MSDIKPKPIEHGSTQHLDLLGAPYHFNLLTSENLADVRAFGRDCMAAERSRIASLLRRKHEEVNGAHNYFLVAARMVEGGE